MKKLLLVLALVATSSQVAAGNKKTTKQPAKKAAVHTHQGLAGEQMKLMELCHRHGRSYTSAPGMVGKCGQETAKKAKQLKAKSGSRAYKTAKNTDK